MTEALELQLAHQHEAVRAGVPMRPMLLPTGWDVGPVAAFLFPGEPATLVDCGVDNPASRAAIETAMHAEGLAIRDLRRIIVTHAHTDHYGCAHWLQSESGCEVLMHEEDAARLAHRPSMQELFRSLGFGTAEMSRFFGGGGHGRPPEPDIARLEGGETLSGLHIEHWPGHSPGHVWVVHEPSGAILAGDYLLAATPTNAGLEPDEADPLGRRPMLEQYHAGLEAMAERDAPVVFPSHGLPITDHRDLIRRRLRKSHSRTDHVLRVLERLGGGSAFDVAYGMYGDRLARNTYDIIADVAGRLDQLARSGRAAADRGPDGVWRFGAGSTGTGEKALDVPGRA